MTALSREQPDRCPMQMSFTAEFATRLGADMGLTDQHIQLYEDAAHLIKNYKQDYISSPRRWKISRRWWTASRRSMAGDAVFGAAPGGLIL